MEKIFLDVIGFNIFFLSSGRGDNLCWSPTYLFEDCGIFIIFNNDQMSLLFHWVESNKIIIYMFAYVKEIGTRIYSTEGREGGDCQGLIY